MKYVIAQTGDTLEALVWHHYGRSDNDLLARTIQANPRLLDSPLLQAGDRVALPELAGATSRAIRPSLGKDPLAGSHSRRSGRPGPARAVRHHRTARIQGRDRPAGLRGRYRRCRTSRPGGRHRPARLLRSDGKTGTSRSGGRSGTGRSAGRHGGEGRQRKRRRGRPSRSGGRSGTDRSAGRAGLPRRDRTSRSEGRPRPARPRRLHRKTGALEAWWVGRARLVARPQKEIRAIKATRASRATSERQGLSVRRAAPARAGPSA